MSEYTIQKDVQTEMNIEKSRFICTLNKVESEAQAAIAISQAKKKYWDATHNCSAYIIGKNMDFQKSSDDGEPAGTAGVPMLEVLRKKDLHNIVAIVTRYFGGIKLGSGGLIRAYGKSVSQAIEEAGLCRKALIYECTFSENAQDAGKVINTLYSQKLFSLANLDYGEDVAITLKINDEDMQAAKILLNELFGRKVEFIACKKKFVEIPV